MSLGLNLKYKVYDINSIKYMIIFFLKTINYNYYSRFFLREFTTTPPTSTMYHQDKTSFE